MDCEKKRYQKTRRCRVSASTKGCQCCGVPLAKICTINLRGYGVVSALQKQVTMKRQRGWRFCLLEKSER